MNITGNIKFSEVTPERYVNIIKLNKRKSQTYFWILNGYIYTTSSYLKALRITLFIEDELTPELRNPTCQDCKSTKQDCTNPYDEEFKAPGFLEKDIVDMTSMKLLQTYHKLQVDHTSDNMDEQTNKD